MESAWKRRTGGDPDYNAKYAIARDAAVNGCLIYSTATGEWYTPKEFMGATGEKISIHRGKDDSDKFKIMKPAAGIKQKLSALHKAETDLQQFMAKVNEYFEFEAKHKSMKR